MSTYVAFLRAINLGAQRKFPKADIAKATTAAGFSDVETYINTGNVRFTTTMRSRTRIEDALEQSYAEYIGFEVPTICFTAQELLDITEQAADLKHPGKHYVSLLKNEPDPESAAALVASAPADEGVVVLGRAVHLLLAENYLSARITNAQVEKKLGVATNRNLTVVRAVAEKWCVPATAAR